MSLVLPDNWAVDMHKKLAMLCEKQLNAILVEADAAFKDIINSATASIRICNEQNTDSSYAGANAGSTDDNTGKLVSDELQKMLIHMQFHDEFSQRLNHVIQLCRLISAHDEEPGESAMPQDRLLERVIEIFSVSAEFTVLQTIFPEYRHEMSDVAIELF